jgi:hypothetical protein
MYIPIITPLINLFSQYIDLFSYESDSPENIERRNIKFYNEQTVRFQKVCAQLNERFKEEGLCNDKQNLYIEPVYHDIHTHVNNIRITIIQELKCTLTWTSPRQFEYSCWYWVNLIAFNTKEEYLNGFLTGQFVNQNIAEWKKNDPYRLQ